MIPINFPKEIKKIEQRYLKSYKNKSLLQDKAVKEIANIVLSNKPKEVIIFFGPGMNGRDGLRAGKIISSNIGQKNVHFISCLEENSSKINLKFSDDEKIKILEFNKKFIKDKLKNNKEKLIIIDAVLGISTSGRLRNELSKKIQNINKIFQENKSIKIYSLDIPTGFDPVTGINDVNTFKSHEIIMLGSQSMGSVINPSFFSKINYVDLGIKKNHLKKSSNHIEALTIKIAKKNFIKRSEVLYKNKFGAHLIIGGSQRYPGAIVLSSRSSNMSGTGHTSVSTSENFIENIIKETPETTIFRPDFSDHNLLKRYNSISIGVGLGQNKYSNKIVDEFLNYIKQTKNNHKVIIDADALNILSEKKYWWEKLPSSVLLTPHIGEFEKIYSFKKYEKVIDKLIKFTDKTGLCVLLKGPSTYISQKNNLIINTSPNGGMSKPGMGDVLTGLIGGIASNPKVTIKNAAILGTYVHSMSGRFARKFKGSTSMTATDVISFIPQVFKSLENDNFN